MTMYIWRCGRETEKAHVSRSSASPHLPLNIMDTLKPRVEVKIKVLKKIFSFEKISYI